MHPIAHQLRESVKQARAIDRAELLLAAADEIDRLTAGVSRSDMCELENRRLQREILELSTRTAEFEPALRLIACGPRPDGTYNYCRDACQQLAVKALGYER